jgi:peroxiredoxin
MRKTLISLLLLFAISAFAGLKPGTPAPDFSLPDVKTGEMVKLSSFRGQVVVLQFWKTE